MWKRTFQTLSVLLLLSGCTKATLNFDSITVRGVATLAPVKNATVTVKVLNKDGTEGKTLGTTTSLNDGTWALAATKNPEPVVVSFQNGSYTDEATGREIVLSSGEKYSTVLETFTVSKEIALTPVTHLAAQAAIQSMKAGSESQKAITDNFKKVAEAVGMEGADLNSLIPPNTTDADAVSDATEKEKSYAILLAGLSQLAKNKNMSQKDLIDSLVKDFAGDQVFDGKDNGNAVTLGSTTLKSDDWSVGLSKAMSDWQEGSFNTAGMSASSIVSPVASPTGIQFDQDISLTTSVTSNSATISWTAITGNYQMDVMVKRADSDGTISTVTDSTGVSSSSLSLTNLTKGTHHVLLKVRSGNATVKTFTTSFQVKELTAPNEPAPTVTSVSPTVGALAGGTTLTIHGTGFMTGATVSVGGNPCISPSVTNSTTMTCTTASHAAGQTSIVVTNADTQSGTGTNLYTFQAAPTVTSVSPTAGALAGATSITITGTGFVSGATVSVGGNPCTSASVTNSTTMTCTTASHAAGQTSIVVTNADTQSGTGTNLYTYQAAPTVTSVSPTAGALAGATSITITGTGFVSGATVIVGGNACTTVSVVSVSAITCTTAAHLAGAVDVVVTNTDTQAATGSAIYTYAAAPTVTSVSPNGGLPAGGTNITITGTDFTSGATVSVGGVSCSSLTFVSATSLTCTTGAHATPGSVNIVVTNADGQIGTAANAFTYRDAPTVTSISTSAGPLAGGTNISITGTGFVTGATVSVVGIACTSVSVNSASNITCTTAAKGVAGSGNVVVTNPDTQFGTGANLFTYQNPPSITSITLSPATLLIGGGNLISITGSNILSGSTATIGGAACENPVVTSGVLTCNVPPKPAGSYNLVVTNQYGQTGTYGTSLSYSTGEAWMTLSTTGAPTKRSDVPAVWTGSTMIIFGGYDGTSFTNTGGQYDPVANSWTTTNPTSAPSIRRNNSAVWTGSKMIVWGGYDGAYLDTGGCYDPISNDWTTTSTTSYIPTTRGRISAVWTGSKMIIWGGAPATGQYYNTGAMYSPETNSWLQINTSGAPQYRAEHSAIWTGSRMVVFGGSYMSGGYLNDGAQFDPDANSWTPISVTNSPSPRMWHSAVWTGRKMIVFGGFDGNGSNGFFNDGGQYDPTANNWSIITSTGAPTIRATNAVWTGRNMLIWGGHSNSGIQNSGALFDPYTVSWVTINSTGAPLGYQQIKSGVWTGSKFIIFGGMQSAIYYNNGGVYTPPADSASNTWTVMTTTAAPVARSGHVAVWSGSKMIIWGGYGGSYLNTGGLYDPITDSWTDTNASGAPQARTQSTAVWTGKQMIVWSGTSDNTGGLYDPTANSWIETSTTGAPTQRQYHSAVWSGNSMYIYGGIDTSGDTNTGGIYTPPTTTNISDLGTWTTLNPTNAPSARINFSTVLTGTRMIVWGGSHTAAGTTYYNDGGTYDLSTNTWTVTTTVNFPTARAHHTAVWTGKYMLIWGGTSASVTFDNSGSIYTPSDSASSDTWQSMSTVNLPVGRSDHSAIWTGSHMFVFGGSSTGGTRLNTAGLFNPTQNEWLLPTNTSAPSGRTGHTNVWTGKQILIWGGQDNSVSPYYTNTGGLFTP